MASSSSRSNLATDLSNLNLSDAAFAVVAQILQFARENEEDAFMVFRDVARRGGVELQFDAMELGVEARADGEEEEREGGAEGQRGRERGVEGEVGGDGGAGETMSDVQRIEKYADEVYACSVIKAVFAEWKEKAREVRKMERVAERYARRRLVWRALCHLNNLVEEQRMMRGVLEDRLVVFRRWELKRVVVRCLRRWIERHRGNELRWWQEQQLKGMAVEQWREKVEETKVLEQRAEDARDYSVTTSLLGRWREKARQVSGERRFRSFYFSLKYVKIWKANVRARRRGRQIEELTNRYHQFRTMKDLRALRNALSKWHGKTVILRNATVQADEYYDRVQAQNTMTMAHNTLRKWYIRTADDQEKELVADEFAENRLLKRTRILSPYGNWRTMTNEIQDLRQKADNFYEIKSQEMALRTFRRMRNQMARSRQMMDQADSLYNRQTKNQVRNALKEWKTKTGERRGSQVVVTAMPTTPAARKHALFTQQ